MDNKLEECILLPIEVDTLTNVAKSVRDWALLHGMSARTPAQYGKDRITYPPFTLIPSSWPRKLFVEVTTLQRSINLLVHRVANDKEFLNTVLGDVAKGDDFMGKLCDMYRRALSEEHVQPIDLAIIRNDVMLELRGSNAENQPCYNCSFKQVELHTMAARYAHYGPNCKALHEYVLQELGRSEKARNLPVNKALHGASSALVKAWDLYKNENAVIMFVVEEQPHDISEERFIEFYIRKYNPDIGVIRCTLTEVFEKGRLDEDHALWFSFYEVGLVYFRTGTNPAHYPTQNAWEARYLLESSKAIKCPPLHYQLASSKKVLQVLTQPGMLERFLNDGENLQRIRKMFAELYEISDTKIGETNYKMAMNNPELFVLKPHREGNEHYVYGADIPKVLEKLSKSERSCWMLMKRIQPPEEDTYIVQPGGEMPPANVKIISELGIFGIILASSDEIFDNVQVGHMLRSKKVAKSASGVDPGFVAMNSVFLVD